MTEFQLYNYLDAGSKTNRKLIRDMNREII